MPAPIFLLHPDGRLDEMSERPFASEDLFQQLLAQHPNLLACDQIDADERRRWLLLAREMPVPCEEDGAARWALDHLFIDQDGIPTLVEVKRQSDSRIRREVVGQLLDYAANAVVYWPVETIRARFEKTCIQHKVDPAATLARFLGDRTAADSFWQAVKTNLHDGRVRLVFVADTIPPELRRVVQFLNDQMEQAEVLAVEVKQYKGQGELRTLIPRLVGQTVRVKIGTKQPIDQSAFLEMMLRKRGADECRVAEQLMEWAKDQGLQLGFVKRLTMASFIPMLETDDGSRYPISVQTSGNLYLQMIYLRPHPPFNDPAKRDELRQKLNAIPGVEVEPDRMTGYPRIPLETLTNPTALQALTSALTWLVAQLKAQPI
jgi:hypothetical protein